MKNIIHESQKFSQKKSHEVSNSCQYCVCVRYVLVGALDWSALDNPWSVTHRTSVRCSVWEVPVTNGGGGDVICMSGTDGSKCTTDWHGSHPGAGGGELFVQARLAIHLALCLVCHITLADDIRWFLLLCKLGGV